MTRRRLLTTPVYCLEDSALLWLIVLWTVVKLLRSSTCVCAWAQLCLLVRWEDSLGSLCTQFLFWHGESGSWCKVGESMQLSSGCNYGNSMAGLQPTLVEIKQISFDHRRLWRRRNNKSLEKIDVLDLRSSKKVKPVTWSRRQRGLELVIEGWSGTCGWKDWNRADDLGRSGEGEQNGSSGRMRDAGKHKKVLWSEACDTKPPQWWNHWL